MKKILLVAALVAACAKPREELPYYLTPELTPQWVSGEVAQSSGLHRIGAFTFTRSDGKRIDQSLLDGKVSVIHFFFTECNGVCPKTQPNLAWMLSQFPASDRVQVVSQSVKPEADSLAALTKYAATHHITDPRWMLLTGHRSEIQRVAKDYYYANLNDGRSYGVNDLAHTETLYLIDQRRMIRGIYNGTLRLDVERLRDDAMALIGHGDRQTQRLSVDVQKYAGLPVHR
jgi:protein SCO1/2